MNKKTKYAINGALIIGVANGLYNALIQYCKNEEDSDYEFIWQELFSAIIKGIAIGGTGGYLVGAATDYYNSKEKPINTDILLLSIIKNAQLDKLDRLFLQLDEKAKILTQILKYEFRGKLNTEPIRLGSTEKGTALKEQFDIDICLAFKPKSFASTEEMYFAVEEVLEKYIGTNSITDIRKQKKSIGVFIEINDVEYKIDVLPKKITKSKFQGNKTSGYLYVNDESLFGRPTYTKTNVNILNTVKLTATQKKLIIAFKDWKQRNSIPLSSHLLQSLVLDAYNCNRGKIPKGISKKLIMVAKHIADHIETITIRSIENTNNILTDISLSDKIEIRNACKRIVEEYEYQPNSILEAFSSN